MSYRTTTVDQVFRLTAAFLASTDGGQYNGLAGLNLTPRLPNDIVAVDTPHSPAMLREARTAAIMKRAILFSSYKTALEGSKDLSTKRKQRHGHACEIKWKCEQSVMIGLENGQQQQSQRGGVLTPALAPQINRGLKCGTVLRGTC